MLNKIETLVYDYKQYGSDFAEIYDMIIPRATFTSTSINWIKSLMPKTVRHVVELGVGTGRIALPLAKTLNESFDHNVLFTGIEISDEMLVKLANLDQNSLIVAKQADITRTHYPSNADAILCVCCTFSMLIREQDRRNVFHEAAKALISNEILVIEVHNINRVLALHGKHQKVSYAVPYPGGDNMLVTFSTLENDGFWQLEHCWISNRKANFVSEISCLIGINDLNEYANEVGLELVGVYSGLTSLPASPESPTLSAVYRRP